MGKDICQSGLAELRNNNAKAAIVFIHGFTGKKLLTWENFLPYIANEPTLTTWDLWTFGYSSKRGLDIPWMWSADASINTLSDLLKSQARLNPLSRYNALALVCHSMGGLVAQKMIVNHCDLALRVSHLFLFGTPSKGLLKAGWARLWKRQIRDMAASSRFIEDLRRDWSALSPHIRPPHVMAVAGERDEFVPLSSAHDPFPNDSRAIVPGNHNTMLNCSSMQNPAIRHVVDGINTGGKQTLPSEPDKRAIAINAHRQLVHRYLPGADGLDDEAFVNLVLSMEELGQQEAVMQLLESQKSRGTDVSGVLAGRLKRRWLKFRQKDDAKHALAVYQDAYNRSLSTSNFEQAVYHGINLAFMHFAFLQDKYAADKLANDVIDHYKKAPSDHWGRGSVGEAYLILGDFEQALEWYGKALDLKPQQREAGAMYEQALVYINRMPDRAAQEQIMERFDCMFGRNII
ncbi:MAG: alpha/beta fold hydrolase [Magnetococcales bacterium]|nr:alpha/beta fold hydrolase [Magnetococcales bacterium]